MNRKHLFCTFILQGNGFFEYISEGDLITSHGEKFMEAVSGYFPIGSNVTYAELLDEPEGAFTVSRIDRQGNMEIFRFAGKAHLLETLPTLQAPCESENYLTFYRNRDFVANPLFKGNSMAAYLQQSWSQVKRTIKRTGRFSGYLRYKGHLQPFNTDHYPFVHRLKDKITLMANAIMETSEFRGKGVTIWVDDPEIQRVAKMATREKAN